MNVLSKAVSRLSQHQTKNGGVRLVRWKSSMQSNTGLSAENPLSAWAWYIQNAQAIGVALAMLSSAYFVGLNTIRLQKDLELARKELECTKETLQREVEKAKVEGKAGVEKAKAEVEKAKVEGKAEVEKAKAEIGKAKVEGKAEVEKVKAEVEKVKAEVEKAKVEGKAEVEKVKAEVEKAKAETAERFLMYGYAEEFQRYQKQAGTYRYKEEESPV